MTVAHSLTLSRTKGRGTGRGGFGEPGQKRDWGTPVPLFYIFLFCTRTCGLLKASVSATSFG